MPQQPQASRRTSRTLKAALRPALACTLGLAAAVLIACGSSGKGLIPAANAGPLKSDIEAVDLAAQEGNGNCTNTNAALQRTDQDFAALPSSLDSGLRETLRQGITNLHKVATALCTQPIAKTTSTPTTSTPAPPATSTPTTKTTPPKEQEEKEEKAEKAKEKEETEQPPSQGGGTPAPGEGNGKSPGAGAGGAGAEEPPGTGAGSQESK